MLGSGINPESFKQDYSGFANAAATQAQGMANLGASIGGAIKDFGEAKKEQKKVDAYNKASAKAIEAAITLGGSYGITGAEETLRPFLKAYNDPNLSPIEKAALLDEGKGMIPNVFGRFDAKQAYAIQEAEALARNAAAGTKLGSIENIAVPGGTRQMVRNPRTGVLEPIKVAGLDGANQAVKGDDLIGLVKGFERFEPKAYNDYKQTSVGYGTKGKPGEVLTEEQASERLQSELSGHAKRIEDAAALKGITLNKNQFNALTSFDFNTGRGVNLIERFGDDPQQLASKILEYNKAGGEVKGGLVKRRQIESALFLAPEQQAAEAPQPTSQNQGGIGFTPAKTTGSETYRPFTPEEIARYGSDGQVSSTGKVYPIRPPSGTEFTMNPDRSVTYKTGAGVGGKNERAEAERQKQQGSFVDEFVQTAKETLDLLPNLPDNPVGAKFGAVLGELLPATKEGRVVSRLNTLKANLALDKINQMRAASPTGGAAGTMTVQEWPLFMQEFGSLDAAEDKTDLANRLKNASVKLFNRVNGTPEERALALKDGRITDEQNKIVEGQYNQMLSNLGITTTTKASTGFELLPDEQKLIDKHKTQ